MRIPAEEEWLSKYCLKSTVESTSEGLSVFVLLSAVTKNPPTGPESKSWTYTPIGPLFPPAKIAPNRRIRIIGNTNEKKRPILVRAYPLAKSLRSDRIRFRLVV